MVHPVLADRLSVPGRADCRWPAGPGSVSVVDPVLDGFPRGDAGKLEAVRLEFEAHARRFEAEARRFEEAKARVRATLDQVRNGRSGREILHDSAFARLRATLDSMPVIEQAKGILMAQHRCGPDEAFDLLRRASQRANVKVSVLAARIVEQVASSGFIGSAK